MNLLSRNTWKSILRYKEEELKTCKEKTIAHETEESMTYKKEVKTLGLSGHLLNSL